MLLLIPAIVWWARRWVGNCTWWPVQLGLLFPRRGGQPRILLRSKHPMAVRPQSEVLRPRAHPDFLVSDHSSEQSYQINSKQVNWTKRYWLDWTVAATSTTVQPGKRSDRTCSTIPAWLQPIQSCHSRVHSGSGWPLNRPSPHPTMWSPGSGLLLRLIRRQAVLQGSGSSPTSSTEGWSVGTETMPGLRTALDSTRGTAICWESAMEATWTATASSLTPN